MTQANLKHVILVQNFLCCMIQYLDLFNSFLVSIWILDKCTHKAVTLRLRSFIYLFPNKFLLKWYIQGNFPRRPWIASLSGECLGHSDLKKDNKQIKVNSQQNQGLSSICSQNKKGMRLSQIRPILNQLQGNRQPSRKYTWNTSLGWTYSSQNSASDTTYKGIY